MLKNYEKIAENLSGIDVRNLLYSLGLIENIDPQLINSLIEKDIKAGTSPTFAPKLWRQRTGNFATFVGVSK